MSFFHRTYRTWVRAIIKNWFAIDDYADAKLVGKRPREATKKQYKYYQFARKIPHVSVFKVRAV